MTEGINDEIWQKLAELKPLRVNLSQVFLDPNNPRLETPKRERIPEERASEPELQMHYRELIESKIGVKDLLESIKTCGFSTVDRIVIKSIGDDNYIVLEGNRRLAALKILDEQHRKGQLDLEEGIINSIKSFEALVYEGEDSDIAWFIQGHRHASGIKEWDDYQKGKFITKMFESGKTPTEIAKMFGLRRNAEVMRLIRSYYAFEQAKEDEDYGEDFDTGKFGIFYHVVFAKPSIREWLEWDDNEKKFKNVDNLAKFVSMIVPDEKGQTKLTVSPRTRDILPKLLQPKYEHLLEEFSDGKKTLEECGDIIREDEKAPIIDITGAIFDLTKTKKIIAILPIAQIQLAETEEELKQKNEITKLLQDLLKLAQQQLKNLGV